MVAENQIRPATTSEVLTKQILELRPSRKRRREAVQDQGGEAPFQEDLMMNQVHDDDEAQPGYLGASCGAWTSTCSTTTWTWC